MSSYLDINFPSNARREPNVETESIMLKQKSLKVISVALFNKGRSKSSVQTTVSVCYPETPKTHREILKLTLYKSKYCHVHSMFLSPHFTKLLVSLLCVKGCRNRQRLQFFQKSFCYRFTVTTKSATTYIFILPFSIA